MAVLGVAALEQHLENVLRYLQPHMSFVNCHMVGYLTDNLWRAFIPETIQSEVKNVEDVAEAIQIFWDFHKTPDATYPENHHQFKGFLNFLHASQALRLKSSDEVAISIEQLNNHLRTLGFTIDQRCGLQIKEFMSEKKNHEVEVAAQVITTLCGSRETEGKPSSGQLCVIDAGDGKGYLSSRLALEHRLIVLGIDANAVNTAGAQKRTAQLERAWTGLTKRAEDIRNGKTPPRKGRRLRQNPLPSDPTIATNLNYQRSTHFITPETNFIDLFANHFPIIQPPGFCLSGLHTCGNLAASCIEIFENNHDIRNLCNVGCCYHLLDEEFAENDFFVERHEHAVSPLHFGFPLSSFLRGRHFAMGRNARMLAAQSLQRTVSSCELPNQSLFYRSLLEKLIVEQDVALKNRVQVGRMKKIGTFTEYVGKCQKRTDLSFPKHGDCLEQLLIDHEFEKRLMDLFYLIRMTFAPILESVILLDRMLYLKERGVDDVCLVKLFDPVVSPRCFAVVAVKSRVDKS